MACNFASGLRASGMRSKYLNEQIETIPLQAQRELQQERLRSQVQYLWTHSAFAREKLESAGAEPGDIRSIEDLSRLPFTLKQELRDSQLRRPPLGDHMATAMKNVVRIHSSSGTTGTPSYVGVTAGDDQVWSEAVARAYWAQGLRPDSMFAMGFSIGFFVGGVPVCNGVNRIGATFLPIGVGSSDRLLTSIASMGADTLACTPSYATFLLEYARSKMGIDPKKLGLRRLMVGAEPGGGIPEIRKRLQDEWGAKVTESVGNADVMPIYGAECEHQDGSHFLVPDHLILEIIDPDSGTVLDINGDGIEGEMVFTHLGRQCAPLLRFRSNDRVVVKSSRCPCGRTGLRLVIRGRTDDMLIVRGVNVWPSAIKDVVTSMRPRTTGELRILLDKPGPSASSPVRIEVEAGDEMPGNASLKQCLEALLREKLIFTASITIVPKGSLPRSEMKAKLIHKTYESDDQ
ncbi:MAG: phenylacetate--CoA ligase family protein [Gammaproteobacteria bacterium]|nr:phenylacetate--CoA ligase family protein [Gammaproteobacteria bacterium]